MKETFKDNREAVKGFGNNFLLSKFLWVSDMDQDEEVMSAFCIDNQRSTKSTLTTSARSDGETDSAFLLRMNETLDYEDATHRPNFKEYVDLQRYFAALSERERYQKLKSNYMADEDSTVPPDEPKYVKRTLDNAKNYYKVDGMALIQLFEAWPFRLRQRVWSDNCRSVEFAPGGWKDGKNGPGYISTDGALVKNVGLLLRCMAGFEEDGKMDVALQGCDESTHFSRNDGKRQLKKFAHHLLDSASHPGRFYS